MGQKSSKAPTIDNILFGKNTLSKNNYAQSHTFPQRKLAFRQVLKCQPEQNSKIRYHQKFLKQLTLEDKMSQHLMNKTKAIYTLFINFQVLKEAPSQLTQFLRKFTRIRNINIKFHVNFNHDPHIILIQKLFRSIQSQKLLEVLKLNIDFISYGKMRTTKEKVKLNPTYFSKIKKFELTISRFPSHNPCQMSFQTELIEFAFGLKSLTSLVLNPLQNISTHNNKLSGRSPTYQTLTALLMDGYFPDLEHATYGETDLIINRASKIKCRKLKVLKCNFSQQDQELIPLLINEKNKLLEDLFTKQKYQSDLSFTFVNSLTKPFIPFQGICPQITALELKNFQRTETLDFSKQFPNLTSLSLTIYLHQQCHLFPLSLKKLSLRLMQNDGKILDQTSSLKQAIKSCKELEELDILVEYSIRIFWEGLEFNTQLKRFQIKQLTESSVLFHMQNITTLTNCDSLEELSMILQNEFQKYVGFYVQLGILISNNSKTLKKINLDFKRDFYLNKQLEFLSAIKKCNKLESLLVSIQFMVLCSPDKSFEELQLKIALQHLAGINYAILKHFSLSFNYGSITELDLINLFLMVNEMNLKSLKLNLNESQSEPTELKRHNPNYGCNKNEIVQMLNGQPYLEEVRIRIGMQLLHDSVINKGVLNYVGQQSAKSDFRWKIQQVGNIKE